MRLAPIERVYEYIKDDIHEGSLDGINKLGSSGWEVVGIFRELNRTKVLLKRELILTQKY